MDYRFTGKSSGVLRGNFDNLDEIISDCSSYLRIVHSTLPTVPLFLVGHSLGGLISLRLSIINSDIVKGLVLLAPALNVILYTNWMFVLMLKATSALSPTGGIKLPESNLNSRTAAAGRPDPLSYNGKMRFSTVAAISRAMEMMRNSFHRIQVPFLAIRAVMDKVVDNAEIKKLTMNASSTDKELYDLPHCWHSIANDWEVYHALQKAVAWIKKRCETDLEA
jgi:acylglycerol lipase